MAPRFLHIPHSESQVVTGKDVTINCTAVGSPKPTVSWTIDSNPVSILSPTLVGNPLS